MNEHENPEQALNKKKKRKIPKGIIAIVIIAIVLVAAYYLYQTYQRNLAANRVYSNIGVEQKNVITAVTATGNVRAKDDILLYLNTTQKVSVVHVKEGDYVTVGQLLIDYDISAEKNNLEQKLAIAELNLKNAEINLQTIALPATGNELLQYTADIAAAKKNITDSENEMQSKQIKINQQQIKVDDAKKTIDKNTELLQNEFVTQDAYDQSVSAYQNSQETLSDLILQKENEARNLAFRQTQLADAENKLRYAKDKLSDEANELKYQQQQNIAALAKIEIQQIKDDLADLIPSSFSPINGNVVYVNVTAGSSASKSTAVIELADLSALLVKADITEYDAPQLEIGQKVNISTSGLPDKIYTGTITRIAAGSVEKEKSSETEVVVPVDIIITDADDKLKSGYTVDIEIVTAEAENVLSVPAQVIQYEGDEKYVYVLHGNTPVKTAVETGMFGDNGVEILSGLNAGDLVVLTPSEISAALSY